MTERKAAPIGINDVGKPFWDGKHIWRLDAIVPGPNGPHLSMSNLEVDGEPVKTASPVQFDGWVRLIPETAPKRAYRRKGKESGVGLNGDT